MVTLEPPQDPSRTSGFMDGDPDDHLIEVGQTTARR